MVISTNATTAVMLVIISILGDIFIIVYGLKIVVMKELFLHIIYRHKLAYL